MNKTVRFPNERIPKKDRMLEKKHVLSRSVDGIIKRLNEVSRGEKTEKIIFSSETRVLRHKLKENLVQLMFLEPEEYGEKAEELIWSKVFYNVIVKVRQCTRIMERLPDTFEKLYRNHLLQGIGFYQDLSLRLQSAYNINMDRGIDFARPHGIADKKGRYPYGTDIFYGCGLLSTDPLEDDDTTEHQKRLRTWATEALHRCLVYMGDLTRYQYDYFRDNVSGSCIAVRYYHQALLLLPEAGLPYNQLAALDATSGQFYMLSAVYDYLRCLSATKPFEGARQNLTLLLDRNFKRYQELMEKEMHNSVMPTGTENSRESLPTAAGAAPTPSRQPSEEQSRIKDVKKLILKILLLAQKFSKAQLEQKEILELAQDIIAELEMCMFAVDLQSCRVYHPHQSSERVLFVNDLSRPKHIPDSVVFRCLIIFVAIWHRMSSLPSSNYNARVIQAFIMTLFATVLNQAVSRVQVGLKRMLGLNDATLALPSPGSSDEDNAQDETSEKKEDGAVGGSERGDRSQIPRRRRRLRRNLNDTDAIGSEDEAGDLPDLSEDEDVRESDDPYNSDGRNSFLVEESDEEDDDDDENFIREMTAPSSKEHHGSLAPGVGRDLQAVPEEVNSNGGVSNCSGSQETQENWGSEAVKALEELKQRLMLETKIPNRLCPFISSSSGPESSQVRVSSQVPVSSGTGGGSTGAVAGTSQVHDPPMPLSTQTSGEDNIEENSDDAFCREMSMKVANFSIETDNDIPPEDEDAPAGVFVETWPEEFAADLRLQQQMEEEASRGELLARRFTIIGNTDLIWCVTLMDSYFRSTDLLDNETETFPEALLGNFATLMNNLNHVEEAVQKGVIKLKPAIAKQLSRTREDLQNNISSPTVALKEDHHLRGFVPLEKAHENLNFNVSPSSVEEEALLRADRLLRLGHRLANSPNVDFSYDENTGIFCGPKSRTVGMSVVMNALQTRDPAVGPEQSPQVDNEIVPNGAPNYGPKGQREFAARKARRNQLMRDMAQLRLKSEIERLEASVAATGSGNVLGADYGMLPPYIVPHTYVLCNHLTSIQRMMNSRRFIIVIPETVVSHLDILKKQEPRAREAIRFLESESHRGHLCLRLQRSGEQIRNSENKPGMRKEGGRWRTMFACARYFAQQAGPLTHSKGLVAMLWTGNETEGVKSLEDEANSEGIVIENFVDFYNKWKQSRGNG